MVAISATGLSVVSSRAVGKTVVVRLSCAVAACRGGVLLSSRERLRAGRVIALERHTTGVRHRIVVVGRAHYILTSGQTTSVSVSLNATGRALLKRFGKLPVTLTVTVVLGGKTTTIATNRLTITAPAKHAK